MYSAFMSMSVDEYTDEAYLKKLVNQPSQKWRWTAVFR